MSDHVMFIISGLERGGAENQLVGLANGLAGRGWRVTLVSYLPFSENSLRSELRDPGVRAVTLNSSNGVLKYASLLRAVLVALRAKPDLVVGFMFHGMMTARILEMLTRETLVSISSIRNERDGSPRKRLLGYSPIISSMQNSQDNSAREWLLRITDELTSAVTVLSQHIADELCGRGVTKLSHTHVIPNSVEIARFDAAVGCREETRRGLGIGENQFLWLGAGRLDVQKDYPNMLRAFGEVARRRPEAYLVIAGQGPLEGEIRSMIQGMGLSERVALLGLRRDMPELFAASDALVLSSAYEGMPVVVLEAMASRRPVVATAVGAVPDLVADGETGIVVPPGNHRALAEGMTRLMELPAAAKSTVIEAAHRRARCEFSPERVLTQWEALFGQLLKDKARR